jgi:hypothetical protein
MDSLRVFLDPTAMAHRSLVETVLNFVVQLAPFVITAVISLYALRHTRRLKEAELADAERQRKSQIERDVSQKSLEVLCHSYRLTHRINLALNRYGPSSDDEQKKEMWKEISDIRNYWEENLFYLPKSVRKHVYPLTNLAPNAVLPGEIGGRSQMMAFDQVSALFKDIESTLSRFMAEYNILDRYDDQSPA